MRIAIDARSLSEQATSNRTYWSELVAALGQRADVELLLLSNAPLPEKEAPANAKAIVQPASGRLFSLFVLPKLARQHGADVVHVQYTVSPFFRTPVVTMVHDVSFLIEPTWFSRKDRTLLRLSVPAACRRAKVVLTPSETCKRELLERIPVEEAKVSVTPLAVSRSLLATDPTSGERELATLTDGSPFALLVGGGSPRKNLYAAIAAVEKARESIPDLRLLVTGRVEPTLPSWAITPGPVREEVLAAAYREAHVLLHPSLHEGFGLTILEAMALGCPVVTTDRGSLPEVAAGAALIYDADDAAGMAQGMVDLTNESVRVGQIEKGLVRARSFDWDRTAELTVQAYRKAIG